MTLVWKFWKWIELPKINFREYLVVLEYYEYLCIYRRMNLMPFPFDVVIIAVAQLFISEVEKERKQNYKKKTWVLKDICFF